MDFENLADVPMIDEVKDTDTVLVVRDGEVFRADGSNLGGAAGIKTAIIKDSNYDNTIAGIQTTATSVEYSCINMTFAEAYAIMAAGEPLGVMVMTSSEGAMCIQGVTMFAGTMLGVECIGILYGIMSSSSTLYWTADGISTEAPSTGN